MLRTMKHVLCEENLTTLLASLSLFMHHLLNLHRALVLLRRRSGKVWLNHLRPSVVSPWHSRFCFIGHHDLHFQKGLCSSIGAHENELFKFLTVNQFLKSNYSGGLTLFGVAEIQRLNSGTHQGTSKVKTFWSPPSVCTVHNITDRHLTTTSSGLVHMTFPSKTWKP